MKNKFSILCILASAIFCGCNCEDEEYKQSQHPAHIGVVTEYQGYEISTIEHDGHDYIVCRDIKGGWHAVSMIHSASCRLCGTKK